MNTVTIGVTGIIFKLMLWPQSWNLGNLLLLSNTIKYYYYRAIGQMAENSPMDERPGFHPRSSHAKDSGMLLDAALFNTQHYKVPIKGKVEQSREWSIVVVAIGVVAIEKKAFGSLSTTFTAIVTM